MKKAVLITGGAGYIGSHAAKALMAEGCRVVILDDLSTGDRKLVPQGAQLVKGSIADRPLVAALLRTCGVKDVLHFAAFVDVAESERRPDIYFENNYRNTRFFLDAARSAGAERFIFSSTAAVYGNPDLIPVPEHALLRPVSVYGRSKMLAEELVSQSGMQYAILRYFNVAGADWNKGLGYTLAKEPTHLIRRAVQVALGNLDHLDIFGTDYPTPDGTTVRDYIHVKDLVQAHLSVLEYLRRGGKPDTFNVGYGRPGYSVLEVVEAVRKVTGKPLPIRLAGRRQGDIMTMVADSRKLIETTGWMPTFRSLGGMVLDELDWVKSQKAPGQ